MHIYGLAIMNHIKKSGIDSTIFEGGENEGDFIFLKCNTSITPYKAEDMIQIYIENWAKANGYNIAEYEDSKILQDNSDGRVYYNTFYNFYEDEEILGPQGKLFMFDITEPYSETNKKTKKQLESKIDFTL